MMEYRISELDEHTWRIVEGSGSSSVYLYLLEGERSAALIDAGYGTIPLQDMVKHLTDKPVTVLLTHGHVDHIGGTACFDFAYLHPEDTRLYLLHASQEVREFFLAGEEAPPVNRKIALLDEKECFDLGGRHLQVIPTPGHSLGSVCYLDTERGWLFSGDTCCQADVLLNMKFSTDVKTYLKSIQSLHAQNFHTIWPAHHKAPVGKEILKEFEEAASLICKGKAQGQEMELAGKKVKRFEWKHIAIVYSGEEIYGTNKN